jgi:hypothetical protein
MAEGDIWEAPTRLYPARQFFVNPAAPDPVRLSYEEAIMAHQAGAYTAAAVMCRRAIEGLCASHGVAERNLAQSLAKLRDQGVINEHLFEWDDLLRVAGNEAAHDTAVRVSKADSRDMLEFTGAIADYVFSFRDKFVAFKARRGGSGAAKKS